MVLLLLVSGFSKKDDRLHWLSSCAVPLALVFQLSLFFFLIISLCVSTQVVVFFSLSSSIYFLRLTVYIDSI